MVLAGSRTHYFKVLEVSRHFYWCLILLGTLLFTYGTMKINVKKAERSQDIILSDARLKVLKFENISIRVRCKVRLPLLVANAFLFQLCWALVRYSTSPVCMEGKIT